MEHVHSQGGTLQIGPTSRIAEFTLFLAVLTASVAGSQTAQYLQTTLGYRQPYFLFYIVHSCFMLSFPIHVTFVSLNLKRKQSLWPLFLGLKLALTTQLSAWNAGCPSSFCKTRLVIGIVCLTAFCSLPALLWYAAIPLTSVTDVTAIWNANAFFAYIFSVKLLGVKWGALRLFAVIIATMGVFTMVYGETATLSFSLQFAEANLSNTSTSLIGNTLALASSVVYGLYQVLYKKYIALPSDLEPTSGSGHYQPLPDRANGIVDGETTPLLRREDIIYPPPFGLHPNLITAIIGLCTLILFWIPMPLLHYYQIETFRPPPNERTLLAIGGMIASGVVQNAGFMILLGVWGPVVTSVGSLLNIVLTFISELYFGAVALTFGRLLGASMIVSAFGILVYGRDTF